ncbi:MAG: hypothetical protein Q8O19_03110, partial [Rectinemataceae bacterium]|nr:hypothetical protein [Rectinemataceae bacterium]
MLHFGKIESSENLDGAENGLILGLLPEHNKLINTNGIILNYSHKGDIPNYLTDYKKTSFSNSALL